MAQACATESPTEEALLAHELATAREIQRSLLPKVVPAGNGFGLAGFCQSARQVGGDFYDVLSLGEDRLLLTVADVMGKGVPAALFAATLRTLVRTLSESGTQPAELLSRINAAMFSELSDMDMFITAAVAVVDTRLRTLTVASSGHCPVLVGIPGTPSREVAPAGLPVGILYDAVFEQETVLLGPGASVVLYTDGITDARDRHGNAYSQARLAQWLETHMGAACSAVELKERFYLEFQAFANGAPQQDDQTFLLLTDEKSAILSFASARALPERLAA